MRLPLETPRAGTAADCLRASRAAGLDGEALDAHTLGWVRRINESGRAYLTPAMLDGRWMVRVAFGGEATAAAPCRASYGS